ncbi:hypothetical protein VPH35_028887 [Triticum aestivum]
MASSSSSSVARSSSNAGDPGYYPKQSPIPYREHRLAYEPASNYWCKEKGARWISWTNANPGRRFLNCQKTWASIRFNLSSSWFLLDLSLPHIAGKLSCQLLVDLRDTVHNLQRENARLNGVNAHLEMGIEERSSINISLRDALCKTKERNKALEEKLCQTEARLK